MTRPLSFRQVLEVVERVPDLSGIVLVGGQALNFWAESLGITSSTDVHSPYGAAVSSDIDFLGSARAALAFGEATGGKVAIAGIENAHSPNTALVTLDIDGEEHLIDFLSDMKGFSATELQRVRRWAVPLKLRQDATRPLYVMHPVHCLEAQLENVYGTALDRRADRGGERYVGRVRLAIEACRRISLRHIEAGDPRAALDLAEKVSELALLPSAMRARFDDGVHVEDAIPDAPAMPTAFREKRLPRLREKLDRMIKKEARRRAARGRARKNANTRRK